MAARLTDKQKKKIIADYVELGSYNAALDILLGCKRTQKLVEKYNGQQGTKEKKITTP